MMMMMIIIIIIIIINYCNNVLNWQYWPTVGPELSGKPGDPDNQETTELSTAMENVSVVNFS